MITVIIYFWWRQKYGVCGGCHDDENGVRCRVCMPAPPLTEPMLRPNPVGSGARSQQAAHLDRSSRGRLPVAKRSISQSRVVRSRRSIQALWANHVRCLPSRLSLMVWKLKKRTWSLSITTIRKRPPHLKKTAIRTAPVRRPVFREVSDNE